MIKLALEAIFSFSLAPIRIGILAGMIFLLLALLEMAYVLSFWIRGRQDLLVPGWSSLMFVILLVGGFLMVTLGFIGIYVGYVFQEVKRRPIYITRRIYGSGAEESDPQEASQAQAMARRAE
jgi:dolichol-phosphate mannosyltransferase